MPIIVDYYSSWDSYMIVDQGSGQSGDGTAFGPENFAAGEDKIADESGYEELEYGATITFTKSFRRAPYVTLTCLSTTGAANMHIHSVTTEYAIINASAPDLKFMWRAVGEGNR